MACACTPSRTRTRSTAWSPPSNGCSRRGSIPAMSDPLRHRPRRMRRTPALRALIRETELAPIASMPGQSQHTLETLRKEAAEIASKGVLAFMLFGVPERKDAEGSEAWNPVGIAQKALRVLGEELGDGHVVIADLCLDEYTDHGHCGVLDDDGRVDNDA